MSDPGGPMSRSGAPASTPAVLAVDTGGTFTDVLLLREGRVRSLKIASTPGDPSEAVLEGVRRVIAEVGAEAPAGDGGGGARGDPTSPGPAFLLVHGSTVATNGLLERRGARVMLVTNRGFEDIIEIGRQHRPQLYALVGHRLPPLVDRDDRIGIRGRLDAQGSEVEPLDDDELAGLRSRLRDAESVALCLLHAYATPRHEERVAEALRELDVPLSVSSRLLPEYREYERTSTTVVNAFVAPLMSRYLGRIAAESGAKRVTVMGSSGGALPVERAREEPVHTVLSGPAGGVVGGLTWAARSGLEDIITFDMGGTSTDVSLCPGEPLRTREFEIAGHPVAVPVIDIHTVGAGGGSLARLDPGGALRVGPRSAGADPGPICYGRGGDGLTVTDAHVWLGRLPPEAFLGGEDRLDRDAVRPALEALASGLDVTPEEAAEGILQVADSAMERALRVISVERGYDAADFVLVAFGGAGGLHVAELAERLGVARAMIPPEPGLLSAYGMLAAPVTREISRTVLLPSSDDATSGAMERVFGELEEQGVRRLLDEGHPRELLTVERSVDARYRGQSFELRVPGADWLEAFHRAHAERYGYRRDESPVEAVTLRTVIRAPGPELRPPRLEEAAGAPSMASHDVHHGGRQLEVARLERSTLRAGHELEGPALVTEYSSTTWLPPGWTLQVDHWGSLHLLPPS